MHTFAMGFKVEEIENGVRLTVESVGGDHIYDVNFYHVEELTNTLNDIVYPEMTAFDFEADQIELPF